MSLTTGTRLGPYQIIGLLGAGGMGEVYHARDSRLDRDVAIKVLAQHMSGSSEDHARFRREAKTISKLNHPHICVLHDIGRQGDTEYLVMELLEGETLAQRLQRGPLPIADVLKFGSQIADALARAHQTGVVHRDLKPGNVMLTGNGAKLMDFGLARPLRRTGRPLGSGATVTMTANGAESAAPITERGTIIGTLQYMSPEQLEALEVDERSDLWALGCVLYEMATGRCAFEGSTPASLISAIMRDHPRAMTELTPKTPPALELVVRRCLAKDPKARWQSAVDLQRELAKITAATGGARPSLHRLPFVILAILAIVGLVAVWSHKSQQSQIAAGAAPGSKALIIVAEFEGSQSDPQLLMAARQLVVAALDQSDRFESVSQDAMKLALEAAGRSDSVRVDGSLAREIAFRNGIKVTVEGRVDRLGNAHSIMLVARDADDGHVLHSITGSARDDEALIPTLGHLIQQLRRKLGERPESLGLSVPRWIAATPSFEAYRKYSEAFQLQQLNGDDRGSLLLLREALRIDPEFAEAWALKAFAHWHLWEGDSASVALAEALNHPHRLTEEGKLFLQGLRDAENGDLEGADAKYRELIRRGYQLSSSLGNHGSILSKAGRYEEALEQYRRAAHVSPFGPQQWVLGGEIAFLLMFGQVQEAEREAGTLKGWYADYYGLAIAISADDWSRADSLSTVLDEDLTRAAQVRHAAAVARAAIAARKSVPEAQRFLTRAQRRAEMSNRATDVEECLELRLLLDAVAGWAGDEPWTEPDSSLSAHGLIVSGLAAALRGDLDRARQALIALNSRAGTSSTEENDGHSVLVATITGCEGAWDEAAEMLAPWARLGARPRYELSPILVRVLTAQAFEKCQQPDSAATYYELALDPTRLFWRQRLGISFVTRFAHERLASIYAAVGRPSDARRHRDVVKEQTGAPIQDTRHRTNQ